MDLGNTLSDHSEFNRDVRRMSNRTQRYPIFEAEWIKSIVLREEIRRYAKYAKGPGDYRKDLFSEVARRGDQMALRAVG